MINRCSILAVILLLALCGKARSQEIIYTLTGTGDGELGENVFSGASFTITSVADIRQVMNLSPGLYIVTNSTATVSVSGIGKATFTIPTTSISNQRIPGVGISAPVQNLLIFMADNNVKFASYGLTNNLGPLTGEPRFDYAAGFATTMGDFTLTSATNATFQAILIPLLSLSRSGTNLALSWTTNAPGFQLQGSPDLGMSTWSNVTNSVLTANGQNQVTVSPTNNQTFYRLYKQQ